MSDTFITLCKHLNLNPECLPRLQEINRTASPNFGYILSALKSNSNTADATIELLDQITDIASGEKALFRLGRLYSRPFDRLIEDFADDPIDVKRVLGLDSPDYDQMEKGFPFPVVRPAQKAIMEQIRKHLLDDEVDNIIVEAPTGIGKSGLAVSAMLSCQSGWLVTANKMLQTQYILEFPWMADFRGRSNYNCANHVGKNCANSPCQSSKAGRSDCARSWVCDYHVARSKAMNYPYTTMNLSALLIHSMYKTGADVDYESRNPVKKPILIIDEAHNLPEAITGVVEISITLDKLRKVGLKDIPNYTDPIHYISFLKQVEELTKKASDDENISPEVAKDIEIIRTLSAKINNLVKELDQNFENWVMGKDMEANGKVSGIRFNPIKVDKYWPHVAKKLGTKTIMLSATILDSRTYMELLGMDPERTKIIKTNSPFDPLRRPMYTRYMTDRGLNMKNLDSYMPEITDKINMLLDHYKDYKGIIHGNTYKICLYLMSRLPSDRILFPENARQQAEMLDRHTKSKNTILLSPSMTEGVDLKGDLARLQIIVKMPYPYLGDSLIRRRKDLYPGYYGLKTALTLIQAYGRTTRNEEDWSHTYILDGNFKNFLVSENYSLPEWFKSAVQH